MNVFDIIVLLIWIPILWGIFALCYIQRHHNKYVNEIDYFWGLAVDKHDYDVCNKYALIAEIHRNEYYIFDILKMLKLWNKKYTLDLLEEKLT